MDAPKYLPPLDPALALRVASLNEDQIEWYSERCAIREFAGGQSRFEAEEEAWIDTARHFGLDAALATAPPSRPMDRK